jgi:tRNA (mo5U34)-methyltransferase
VSCRFTSRLSIAFLVVLRHQSHSFWRCPPMMLNADRYLLATSITKADLQAKLDAQGFWFHSFAFTNGCRTNGQDPSERKLHAINLPPLAGKSVIDIGAFEGYFAFQAELLGASRVVACDHLVWNWPDFNARSNFEMIRQIASSRVEDVTLPVEELNQGTIGEFDITLFLGVLYHASDMIGYLRNVRSVTREMCIVETLVDGLHLDQPWTAYYPAGSLNNDASNWWGPNIACVLDMLRRVGFRSASFEALWDLNSIDRVRGDNVDEACSKSVRSGRAVFHAYV